MKKKTEKKPIADRGYVLAVTAGYAAALGLSLGAAALIGRGGQFDAVFARYGALFGAASAVLYLLFRFIARAVVKKKKGDPAYFRNKMRIIKYEKSLGMGLIMFSLVVASVLIAISANVFWAIVIGYPGVFIPFSRFLLADKPVQQNDAGVIRAKDENTD
ncbi:MAG: hypothetical protein IJL26_00500 [Clostridia bacterium]|nr:hypothetical protein [Clostridia bacterium]